MTSDNSVLFSAHYACRAKAASTKLSQRQVHYRKVLLCMQGFVSNRDSEKNEDKADPLEIVLYAVFVATSARASVGELADILQVGSISQQTSPTSRKPAYCHTPFHCTSSKDACIQLNMRPIKQFFYSMLPGSAC